jgi:hypothetical protein
LKTVANLEQVDAEAMEQAQAQGKATKAYGLLGGSELNKS